MAKTALIDTNILVYTYDRHNAIKQAKAKQILADLYQASAGYMSVKTLSEFFLAVRRLPGGLSTDQALTEMEKYAATWNIIDLTPKIALEAARGVRDYQFQYWDAQMWATAKIHGLNALFTENMSTGSTIETVTIMNPLDPTFNLSAWLAA